MVTWSRSPYIEDILFSKEYINANNKMEFFLKAVEVVMKRVYDLTVGQAKNENWLICKKNRLTASNFGVVLLAVRRNKYPPSLFKRLTNVYNLEHIKAVQWGSTNEPQALEDFVSATGLEIVRTGLWLHRCGFLGASPDGLIGNEAVIEIKCPYKYREKSLKEALTNDTSYIVFLNKDGDLEVNKNHEYYHQIQGVLYITGRKVCHLMIWTPDEKIIVEIAIDDMWVTNFDLLKTFYLDKYLEFIINSQ